MQHALVIEDSYLFACYLGDVLRLAGATSVSIAATESEAIDAACYKKPDLILSDVALASGNGVSAVLEINREGMNIPVIFVTGNGKSCDRYKDDHVILTKPVSVSTLITTIAAVMKDTQSEPQRLH